MCNYLYGTMPFNPCSLLLEPAGYSNSPFICINLRKQRGKRVHALRAVNLVSEQRLNHRRLLLTVHLTFLDLHFLLTRVALVGQDSRGSFLDACSIVKLLFANERRLFAGLRIDQGCLRGAGWSVFARFYRHHSLEFGLALSLRDTCL